MTTLLGEIHFWNNFNDSLEINSNDFSAIRHNDKKSRSDTLSEEGKRLYCDKRYGISSNSAHSGTNRKNVKIKELDEALQQHRIVYSKWKSNNVFQLVFNTGLIVTITINTHTCAIEHIGFDNYFVGKLDSDMIYDVLILKSHILFILHDNLITLAHLSKPLKKHNIIEKLSRSEVQMHTQSLSSTIGKCKISANINGDLIALWRMYNGDEVQPWTPSPRDPTNANIHIYTLARTKLELVCTYRTDFDPICVTFTSLNTNVLHSVEQKISSKGVVTVETCSYEVQKSQLARTIVTSIPLQKQICCHCFNSSNRKLVLGCIDGSIVLFDQGKGTTLMIKINFIPTMITLNNDGSLILVANEQSQMRFFDIALNSVSIQMIGEEGTPTNILDFSQYFKTRPTLSKLLWCLKPDNQYSTANDFTQTDSLVLMLYERGHFAALKLASTNGIRSNVCEMGYTPDVTIKEYLSQNQIDKAVNVLLSLDWNFWGTICLISLNRIFNFLVRQPFTPEIEGHIQTALSSFHAPAKPHCQEVIEEYENSVKSLSRRFFHLLIRYQLFEKAFCLAIDIGDHDLFMDMNYYAWFIKDYEMAIAAKNKAIQLLEQQ